ncbi:transposase, partial [Streptomyces carpinensis]
PWEQSARPGRLTPARVRRGFRGLHGKTPQPACAPKSSTAGPGRPAGSKNRRRAREHPVGKQNKTDTAKPASKRQAA